MRVHTATSILAALILSGFAPTPRADAHDLTICAQRDLQLVNLMEADGESQTVFAEKLAAAARNMMRARRACREGRFDDALALYSSTNSELALARAK